MMMVMMMISKPNFKKAEKEAYLLLETANVRELPVKVKKLAKLFPNLKIKTYSWYADKWRLTIDEVCEFADSDEGCCWYIKSQDKYLILYNDQVENIGRVRWTIAHELGHYILKHNEKSNKAIFARSSLSETEYDVFEKEANCFARTILAPLPVLSNLGNIDVPLISDLCHISWEASSHIISFLQRGREMGISYSQKTKPIKLFSNYIYKLNNKHFCRECRSEIIKKNIKFCPVCGASTLYKTIRILGVEKDMLYNKIELDDEGRAITCPTCENEEVHDGTFCKICGVTVINKCGNMEYWNGELQWECGELAEGNARFCTKCGHATTFFENKILRTWQAEKEEMEEQEQFMNSPF
ncbi:ImmA/IrrE family metallo-endopeptidase (plasmid) [Cytobacillus spongiae]|uniref:ImmA/IrrE family metallo-endopeptidase n=1 Tax=Cytobacillus spongiae TaxID=2901381 RepID=UPI001F3739A8|nr:ImmA/IrrE family metallo-endopeptidase [Cytobacillus spongiae]UII58089.1 ImmA/IrrE family metallo-endopeptidase [Cytobacillus spongiae]